MVESDICSYGLNSNRCHHSVRLTKFNYHTEQATSLKIPELRVSRHHISAFGHLPTVILFPKSDKMYHSVCKMVSGNNMCIKLSLNCVVSYISKLCLLPGVLSHCIAEAVLSAGCSIWNISQWIGSDQVYYIIQF